MEDDDNAALSVGFNIDFHDAQGQLRTLDEIIGKTAADAVRQFQRIEAVTKGSIDLGGATARITSFGNAATRELENVRRATANAEKGGEAMVRQLERQAQTFGKTSSEIRQMRAELRAVDAESRGLTELAGRIRNASAELSRLEAAGVGGAKGVNKSGSAMAALAPQAQDAFTQISMGTNVLNVLAIQGGQVASQMAHMGGAAGAFANFMLGPWGLALTGAALLAGTLGGKLFDGAVAAEAKEKAAKELTSAIDALSDSTRASVQTEWEAQRATLASAAALRQKALDARTATIEELSHARAKLASALAESARPDPSRGQDGGIDFALTRAAQLDRQIKTIDDRLGAQQRELAKTEVAFRNAQIAQIGSDVAARLDKATGLNRAYQKQLAAINGEFQRTGDVKAYQRARESLEATYARETDALESAGKSARAAAREQAKARREQAKATRDAAAAERELRSTFEGLQGRLDPIAAANRGYVEMLANIRKVRAAGLVGDDDAASWQFAASRQAAEQAKRAVEEVASGIADLPKVAELEFKLVGLDQLLGLRDPETWDDIAGGAARAARGMEDAFGSAGAAMGDLVAIYADLRGESQRLARSDLSRQEVARRTAQLQVRAYGDMASAARGFFVEGSDGYKAMGAAVKVFRAVEFALSVKAIAQDAIETGVKLAKSAARTAANGVEAVSKALASLPFPANIAAGAATIAALAAIGVSIAGSLGGGGKNTLPKANDGSGTVLGDTSAKSESIRRAIDALKEVDTLTLNTSREMLASLRAIETSIGGVASLVVRAGNVNADVKVNEGFQKNLIGSVLSKIPLVGGVLGSLFGSKTEILGGGLYGGAQSLGGILDRGFDASYYTDTKKTSKFLGISTGTGYKTSYTGADAGLEGQFTLLLRQFNDAIVAAAGPLAASTGEIEARLRGFVVNIGKIDLKGLTGAEIEEKLSAVFGAAADQMAAAAIPGLTQFQKVGEGAFETLVRVASTVEAVTATLDQLGMGARGLGIDAKMGIAAQFESVSAMSGAVQAYADAFYTREEQAAAKQAQLASVFASLGMVMPATLSGFRQLVDAQDLTSAAGQKTYATLIQLGPAFAELKEAMDGAKSAADILAERQDLERKLLELRGDTAALRALDLAKLDASNRALQQQVWAVQDAMEAAKAADELRQAWTSVGDGIMDEVKRIRGLSGNAGGGSFAALQGQFNAASQLARAGDQEAAKSLPGLSQALLTAAANAATSRQELDRVQAQTAASLEATYAAIQAFSKAASPASTTDALLSAVAMTQSASAPATAANDDMAVEMRALRAEVASMRTENSAGHAATAANTRRSADTLDRVTEASGGDAISIGFAA